MENFGPSNPHSLCVFRFLAEMAEAVQKHEKKEEVVIPEFMKQRLDVWEKLKSKQQPKGALIGGDDDII